MPEKRACIMCGSPMVEVRRSAGEGGRRQDWQCPRCLHVEHDVYDESEVRNAKHQ